MERSAEQREADGQNEEGKEEVRKTCGRKSERVVDLCSCKESTENVWGVDGVQHQDWTLSPDLRF